MGDLMDRLRHWMGLVEDHADDHADIHEELVEQKARVRALDAYLEARSANDRRQALTRSHPKRRASDG